MSLETATPAPSGDFLDITPLARRYGFRIDVKIEKGLAAQASDETMIGCLLRAAADALMMRGSRPQAMNPLQLMRPIEAMSPLVFAIKTLRAPAQLLSQLRFAMQLDDRGYAEPTLTLRLAS